MQLVRGSTPYKLECDPSMVTDDLGFTGGLTRTNASTHKKKPNTKSRD